MATTSLQMSKAEEEVQQIELFLELEELGRSLLASLAALSPLMDLDDREASIDVKNELIANTEDPILSRNNLLREDEEIVPKQPRLLLLTAMIYNAICALLKNANPISEEEVIAKAAKAEASADIKPVMLDVERLQNSLASASDRFSPSQKELLSYVLENLGHLKVEFSEWINVNHLNVKSVESLDDLHSVVKSIDRVLKNSPRYDEQSVAITDEKRRKFDIARLAALIEKASNRPDMDNQRIAIKSTKFGGALDVLIQHIGAATERKLSNQCYNITPEKEFDMEKNKIAGLMNKQKQRYEGQDWESKEQRFLKEISNLHAKLIGIKESEVSKQRFALSPAKEQNMFYARVQGQMERMNANRMTGQDATFLLEKKRSEFEIKLNNLHPRLNDQAASFTKPSESEKSPTSPNLRLKTDDGDQKSHKRTSSFAKLMFGKTETNVNE